MFRFKTVWNYLGLISFITSYNKDESFGNARSTELADIFTPASTIPRQMRFCAGQILRAIYQSNAFIAHRATSYLPIIFSRATRNQAAFQHVHSCTHDRTDHTEIDACGSYGGSCATSLLLWEGTRCVNGCRCWGSMSQAVIVPIVNVLRL